MTKLLVAASALAVGLSLSGMAYAGGPGGPGPGNNQGGNSTTVAVAAGVQGGEVKGNDSFVGGFDVDLGSWSATNKVDDRAFDNAQGLFNVQQNAGANSLQQSANTLGAVLNCSCSDNGDPLTASLALSAQAAAVTFNHTATLGVFVNNDTGNSLTDSAFDHAMGLFNVSQNVGANSMQQAQNTVAAIVGTGH